MTPKETLLLAEFHGYEPEDVERLAKVALVAAGLKAAIGQLSPNCYGYFVGGLNDDCLPALNEIRETAQHYIAVETVEEARARAEERAGQPDL